MAIADESRLSSEITGRVLTPECRARLVQRDQLVSLGRLVAGVAHELNNPLAAVTGLLDLVKEIVAGDQLVPRDLQMVRELVLECESAADRIRQLVVSLKDMGRVTPREVAMFDPAKTIRDAVRLFAVAKSQQCRIDLTIAALPAVRGSSARLGQVIINLLQNGLDAAGKGATLRVRSDSGEGLVRILVIDQGPGIPRQVADRIFEPFVSSKGDDGMGLGLSICQEIISEMGGAIDFDTSSSGTTFKVTLPACTETDRNVSSLD